MTLDDPVASFPRPAHRCFGCCSRLMLPGRRLFGGALLAGGAALALPGWAREGVDVGNTSALAKLVPADQIEQAAAQQYAQMQQQAAQKGALAPRDHPQAVRLRSIAERIIPFSYEWNPRDRKSTRLNSSHVLRSRMPSSA